MCTVLSTWTLHNMCTVLSAWILQKKCTVYCVQCDTWSLQAGTRSRALEEPVTSYSGPYIGQVCCVQDVASRFTGNPVLKSNNTWRVQYFQSSTRAEVSGEYSTCSPVLEQQYLKSTVLVVLYYSNSSWRVQYLQSNTRATVPEEQSNFSPVLQLPWTLHRPSTLCILFGENSTCSPVRNSTCRVKYLQSCTRARLP